MKKIMLVFGTRPEAIKMCPLVIALRERNDCEVTVCVTGQHREMLDAVLRVFNITPEYDLDVMLPSQTLFDITERVLAGIKTVITEVNPDILLVHGDTTTSFAAALASFYMGIPVGHVEAGLRTYDILSPYPEEFNRQAIDALSACLFAPTEETRGNLLREGKLPHAVFVTGNTEIDALRYTVRGDYDNEILRWAFGSRLAVMTAHRRENLGEPFRRIFTAIRRVIDETPDLKLVYPVHMNPAVQKTAEEILGGHERIKLTDPMDAIDFHNLLNNAYVVLTDSGGIQESAPALHKPVIVLRDVTERPEGVKAGTLKLAGTSINGVYNAFMDVISDQKIHRAMSSAVNPYGDGHAAEKIAEALLSDNGFWWT